MAGADNEEAVDYARALFNYRAKYRAERPKSIDRMMAQILIDLTDVPAQPPFLRSPNGVGSSKYQGVGFNKVNNTWQPKITIDKKQKAAAVEDYARAVRKYRTEIKQKGWSSSHIKAQHDLHDSVGVGRTNQTRQEAICKDHKQKEKPGSESICPKNARLVSLATRFHILDATLVFSSGESALARKKFADSRPRIKGL
eukprot:scaffold1104_cov187-Skeletonema_menzelii.AAC.3